jgi:hypothetical protein
LFVDLLERLARFKRVINDSFQLSLILSFSVVIFSRLARRSYTFLSSATQVNRNNGWVLFDLHLGVSTFPLDTNIAAIGNVGNNAAMAGFPNVMYRQLFPRQRSFPANNMTYTELKCP